jgi:hypothetical protein
MKNVQLVITSLALKREGTGIFMIPLCHIFTTITSEDWDNGGDSIREWVEQYLPLELHLQRKKRNGSHFAML